jgi:hypothetical protein
MYPTYLHTIYTIVAFIILAHTYMDQGIRGKRGTAGHDADWAVMLLMAVQAEGW